MIKNVEELIEETAEKLYPFAYSLCLDELMASQLVIDGISRFVLEHDQAPRDQHYLEIYKGLFTLAKHRHHHHNQAPSQNNVFAGLPLINRCVLYLSEKSRWSVEDISYVCGEEASQVKLTLHQSRGFLQQDQSRIMK